MPDACVVPPGSGTLKLGPRRSNFEYRAEAGEYSKSHSVSVGDGNRDLAAGGDGVPPVTRHGEGRESRAPLIGAGDRALEEQRFTVHEKRPGSMDTFIMQGAARSQGETDQSATGGSCTVASRVVLIFHSTALIPRAARRCCFSRLRASYLAMPFMP